MRSVRVAKGFCIVAMLAAALPAQAQDAPFAKGRLLLKPAANVSADRIAQLLAQHGAKTIKVIQQINLHVVQLPPQASEKAVAALLANNPLVKFVELDSQLAHQQTANDTYYSIAWHLPKIQADIAWDTSKGSNITVAIVDTGVYAAHPDLSGKVLSGWNVVSNSSDTSDIAGHGTGVAGTVAAASNNAQGVTSVAWNAALLPVRVTNSSDGSAYISDLANGVVWATDHGARIANVSYGVSGSSSVQSAANYMRSKNGIVVVSAGNSGAYDATSASDAFLSVGATESNDAIATFSTYGNFVDLSAPGVGVPSTNSSGGYSKWNGTSFSSPVVAGVAALVLAANPGLSPSQVDKILTSTTDDLGSTGYDMYYGAGRVNANRAVQLALNTPAGGTSSSGTTSGTSSGSSSGSTTTYSDTQAPNVSFVAPADGSVISGTSTTISLYASDNVAVTQLNLMIDGKLVATSSGGSLTYKWNTRKIASGSHVLSAIAQDGAGNATTNSIAINK